MIYDWPELWQTPNNDNDVGRYAVELNPDSLYGYSEWMIKNIGKAGRNWHYGSIGVDEQHKKYYKNFDLIKELEVKMKGKTFLWVSTEEDAIKVNARYGIHTV